MSFITKHPLVNIELYLAQQQSVQTLRYQITKCVVLLDLKAMSWAGYGLDRGADTSLAHFEHKDNKLLAV